MHAMSRRNLAAIPPCVPATSAHTRTIARALAGTSSHTASDDYLFLEAWERQASPELAAELRAELSRGRAAGDSTTR